jgi:hypothetical protein
MPFAWPKPWSRPAESHRSRRKPVRVLVVGMQGEAELPEVVLALAHSGRLHRQLCGGRLSSKGLDIRKTKSRTDSRADVTAWP